MAKLEDLLKSKKCFKLVCGAGNEDAHEIEKLVALYAKAGARYFDLSAKEDVVLAAKAGLERSIVKNERSNYFFNISVGIKGDPHVSKARISMNLCTSCSECAESCQQKAIKSKEDMFTVVKERCIGCGDCVKICPVQAISMYSQIKPFVEVLPPLVQLGLDSLEFHAVSDDEEAVQNQWRIIESCFNGILSICIDRSVLGDRQFIQRIKKMIDGRDDFSTVIQADGAPMSGSDDKPTTTLQALACAKVVQDANLPVFLMLSGGTNSTTAELAQLFHINAHGIAIGSFARKLVRDYINRDDFLDNNEIFAQALEKASWLVKKSLTYMG